MRPLGASRVVADPSSTRRSQQHQPDHDASSRRPNRVSTSLALADPNAVASVARASPSVAPCSRPRAPLTARPAGRKKRPPLRTSLTSSSSSPPLACRVRRLSGADEGGVSRRSTRGPPWSSGHGSSLSREASVRNVAASTRSRRPRTASRRFNPQVQRRASWPPARLPTPGSLRLVLDDILVGDNVRDIDQEHVENLAQSIALRGASCR